MSLSVNSKDENANTLLVMPVEEANKTTSSGKGPNKIWTYRDASRNRLLSDSSEEVPKSILKNRSRIPTKRSVSECVDDLSQIMADLDITIDDFSKATGRFCPHKHYFDETKENSGDRDDDEDDDGDDDDCDDEDDHDGDHDTDNEDEIGVGSKVNCRKIDGDQLHNGKQRKCDCNFVKDGDTADYPDNTKPKKSVRFDEKVYETYFIASRLYDRRCFAKYHSSSRHHPPQGKQQGKKQKQSKKNSSKKPDCKGDCHGNKTVETGPACKLSKSQRAKQSKKDKKKRMNKREDGHETGSDDQGYCSSTLHSFSDD